MPTEIKTNLAGRADKGREDDEEENGEEIDPKAHAKLVDGINQLTGSHFIHEVTRTEPSLNRSEFGLTKTKQNKVGLEDVSKFVKKPGVVKLLRKLKSHQPLLKPLEKPAADRLLREESYKFAQARLNLWEPVVKATEVAPQVTFPLRYEKVRLAPEKELSQYRVKTKLMEEMEQLEKEYTNSEVEQNSPAPNAEERKYRLTLQEMRQRTNERARQKRLQSYKIIKERRDNRIKSKKYHRLLKKDKVKQQIKQFEELKEKNPEEALKQLDQIEKQRFMERATLRHKNTGTWAKNLQIRAKYDMDVRRELAEQLAIGRELTAKRLQQDNSSSESDGEDVTDFGRSGSNPWTAGSEGVHTSVAGGKQHQQLINNYRKYWEERNRAQELQRKLEANGNEVEVADGQLANGESVAERSSENGSADDDDDEPVQTEPKKLKKKDKNKRKKEIVRMASGCWEVEDEETNEKNLEVKKKVSKIKRKKEENRPSPVANVEELFREAEELIQDALSGKLERVQRHMEAEENASVQKPKLNAKQDVKSKKRDRPDLSFKKKARLADADDELNETTDKNDAASDGAPAAKVATLNSLTNAATGAPTASAEINLKQVVKMKPKHLLTALPNTVTVGELSDDEPEEETARFRQRLTIAEAFQDDDIVADFEKEKRDERERHLPQEVDLTLPGWNAWAGPGVAPRKPRQHKTRTILKTPKELPRKDDNRDQVIINEDALVNPELSKHLVNEVPFPYATVKDYEASLRAPLGRTFLPETAHVTLIEPRVVTKQGAVIQPMKKCALLANPKRISRQAPVNVGIDALQKYSKHINKIENKKVSHK